MSQLNRLGRNAIVLSLADELKSAGSWCGETHLQKSVYLLQELTRVPLGFDFILYKHGPFSFDLRDALTAMRADYQLQIQATYTPCPLRAQSCYHRDGAKLQERLSSVVELHRKEIAFVAKQLGSKSVTELEQLGTALYVNKEDDSRSLEQVAQRVNELKPHIPMDVAREAADGIDEIIAAYSSPD